MISSLTVGQLVQAIGLAFAGGVMLLFILTLIPTTRYVARKLWPVLASEAAILAVGVLPWLLSSFVVLALLLVAAARIGYESGTIHGLTAGRDFRMSYSALLFAVSALSWFAPSVAFLWGTGIVLATAFATITLTQDKSVCGSLARFTVFPLVPLAAFSQASSYSRFAPLLVLAFFLVEVFDSFSLLGGKLYGRSPLVPRLSPRKTWEGLVTGIGAVVVTLFSLVAWLKLPLLPMLLAGTVVVIAAIAGDLLGSFAKRRAGVKDYPAVMTVQGGFLDIVDAWMVAGPCIVALAIVLGWR